jgi:hypothetical protein
MKSKHFSIGCTAKTTKVRHLVIFLVTSSESNKLVCGMHTLKDDSFKERETQLRYV